MKLFQNAPTRNEGDYYPDVNTALITYGKCSVRPLEIVRHPDGTIEDCPIQPDGWYLRFVSPFKMTRNIINPHNFELETHKCRFAYLIRVRKLKFSGITKIYRTSCWVPVQDFVKDDTPNIRYDDAYTHALNIKDKL